MSKETTATHGVMEGKGAYNRHAKLPAGGAALAVPLLEKAVSVAELGPADQPLVIADYGSSQGKNSMVPMRIAIKDLRQRVGSDRTISVYHIDQPANDFNTLFEALDADPDSYCLNEPNVFPGAIGRSFYENVLPPESVHLGWCSYAAVWLSRVPTLIPGHFMPLRSTGAVRAEFERQGAEDWETFLTLRARELRSGGRLVVVLPGFNDDGLTGFENIMDQANDALAEMAAEGAITAEQRERMVVQSYLRWKRELIAPFAKDGHFHDLTVEALEMSMLRDGAWTAFERDRNRDALATKHAMFFRSVFMPSLATALERAGSGNAEARNVFADRLEAGLKRRVMDQPAAMHSFVQTIVLAKRR